MFSLISELKSAGVLISKNDGNIELFYDGESLPELLINKVKENKPQLLRLLQDNNISSPEEFLSREMFAMPTERSVLSFAQERLIFISQLDGGTNAYHIPYLVRLNEDVSLDALEGAFAHLVARHRVLGSVYRADEDGNYYQDETPEPLRIEVCQVSDCASIQDVVSGDILRPFDLANEIPLRITRYVTGKGHYLLIMWHHIAFDGWSTDIFFGEFKQAYNALCRGKCICLPDLSIQYKDYALWQREYLQGDVLAQQLSYWTQQLSGYELLELPTDRPRPLQMDYRGNNVHFELDVMVSDQLRELAKSQGTTLYTVLLSAFYVTLARFSDQDDILLGTPSDNRQHPQTQSLIGFFVNSLVLRTQVNLNMTAEAIIQQVHEIVIAAKAHQELPFERLVDALHLERDLSRHPLFQVMFGVQHFADGKSKIDNLPFEVASSEDEAPYPIAKFDLSLSIDDGQHQLQGDFNYAVSLFDPVSIQKIARVYQRILGDFAKSVTRPLKEIDLLCEQERHTLLHRWSQTDAPYPQDKTLPQLFEAQVEKTPDEIALVFEDKQLSYRELNARANQLAHAIREQYQVLHGESLQPDTLIALYLDRSLEMVISILAVLKAGGAYVPISPESPKERMRFMLEDTRAPLLLTQQRHFAMLECSVSRLESVPVLIAVDVSAVTEYRSTQNLTPVSAANDLAYVIYTSGTTGQPKGVMTNHQSLSCFMADLLSELNQSPVSLPSFTQYIFDIFSFEYISPLITGGMLILSSSDRAKDDIDTNKETINCIQNTPSMWQLLLDNGVFPNDMDHVQILIGGESGSPQLYSRLAERFPDIYQVYGPTETCVWSTISAYETGAEKVIGQQLAHEQCFVLGDGLNLLPIGAPGELYIGGAGLARGYLNRPELTAERFIDNPFASAEDKAKGYSRLYKTGDRVRWLPDGHLQYLGRNDCQVKIRGFRIELGEIESILSGLPQVKQAVVVDHERQGEKYLAAYIVAELNETIETTVLVEQLSAHLPDYMVPATFTLIDSIPLTLNGKLDRRALPEPEFVSGDSYVAPRNELEAQLCEIWQQVLGVERVGVHDNFFRSGGNSIAAVKLAAAIRRDLEVDMPLALLFEQRTISGLAIHLDNQQLIVIPHREQERYPLSFAQERMLFVEQYEQGTSAYHIPYLALLDEETDIALLTAAINAVVARHPVQQAIYSTDSEGNAYQQYSPQDIVMHTQDFSDESEFTQGIKSELAKPFDLTAEPGIRLHHYQVAEKHYLLMMWHHITMDGWSTEIFMSELAETYRAFKESRAINLPAVELHYGDYAQWQREYLQGEIREQQLQYWRQALSGFEPLSLFTDRSRPSHIDYRGQDYGFELEPGLSEQLRALAKAKETTLYTVLLSGFYVTLARLSSQSDIIVGTPTDNRHHAQTQSMIGMFVNSLALRAQVESESSIEDFIAYTHDRVTQAKVHQELPFEQLVDALNLQRDTSRHPIFQVMFGVQSFGDENEVSHQLPFTAVQLDGIETPAKYDLTLFLSDGQQSIKGCMNFAVSLFNKVSIERMVNIYQRVLTEFVADKRKTLGELNILSASERHTLLHVWNQTDAPYPQDKTIQQLFEDQVEKTPENIALVFEDKRLTYRELNARANQLAHAIREQHQMLHGEALQPDTLIALYLDRSLEMVISILAVLKAGGAYVPISPEYPQERTCFMLEDTRAPILLTQQPYLEKLEAWVSDLDSTLTLISTDVPAVIESQSKENPVPYSGPDNLAYVIYTSGTTGRPKGVMIQHFSLNNRIDWMQCKYPITTADIVLQKTPYTFDVSVWEFVWPLVVGSKLVVSKPEGHKDSGYLTDLIQSEEITVLHFVPSMFGAMLQDPSWSDCMTVRQVFCSGEALPVELVKKHYAMSKAELDNLYGPTEASIDVSFWSCKNEIEHNSVPIGRPINNTQLYVLDNHQELVPMSAPGELYIGGAGVALGYLNRPELTAERFIDNPFATEKNKAKGYTRLYKTGDLVRWLPDGNLEYLGRNDFQVKIRGFRIELGEIESALSGLPQVKQAVVIDREREGEKYLAAYIVAGLNEAIDTEVLVKQLSASLPDYMVPATFTLIDSIPLTLNGKLDRRALPEPEWVKQESYVAPRNELEAQLCDIWKQTLGLELVGIEDDFFRIGGDSIVCIQLASRMRREGLSVQIKDIFDAPTVVQLAQRLLQSRETEIISNAEQGKLTGSFGLLPIQQQFFEQRWTNPNHWNQSFILSLPGDISVSEIELALRKLAMQHDMLRCSFEKSGSGYQQRYHAISEQWMAPLHQLQITNLKEQSLFEQLTQWQSEFDLIEGPLWCTALLSGYPDGSLRLFFAFHHLIIDAVSWRIISEDMRLLLTGQRLSEKSSSYRQWVGAVKSYANEHRDECDYWNNVLLYREPAPALQVQNFAQLSLSVEQTEQLLRKANRGYHTEINDLLLSALAMTLKETFNRNVNHIILEGHGRESIDVRLDTSRTVGWFTTTFPVRLQAEEKVSDTIIHTKEMLREIPNKGIGFGAMKQSGDLHIELPEIIFNYLGQLDNAASTEDSRWQITDGAGGRNISIENNDALLLNINGAVQKGHLLFNVESRLLPVQTERFCSEFKKQLAAVISACIDLVDGSNDDTRDKVSQDSFNNDVKRCLGEVYPIEKIERFCYEKTPGLINVKNSKERRHGQTEFKIKVSPPQRRYFERNLNNVGSILVERLIKIDEPVCFESFRNSILELIRRHVNLSLAFLHNKQGVELELNRNGDSVHLRRRVCSHDDLQINLNSMIDEFRRNIDVFTGPAFAFGLIECADRQHALFVAPHILCDAASADSLMMELNDLCSGRRRESCNDLENYLDWLDEFEMDRSCYENRYKKLYHDLFTHRLHEKTSNVYHSQMRTHIQPLFSIDEVDLIRESYSGDLEYAMIAISVDCFSRAMLKFNKKEALVSNFVTNGRTINNGASKLFGLFGQIAMHTPICIDYKVLPETSVGILKGIDKSIKESLNDPFSYNQLVWGEHSNLRHKEKLQNVIPSMLMNYMHYIGDSSQENNSDKHMALLSQDHLVDEVSAYTENVNFISTEKGISIRFYYSSCHYTHEDISRITSIARTHAVSYVESVRESVS